MATTTDVKMLSTSTLANEPVRNTAGEHIGKIEDYMVDISEGCIGYAVLSFGGFLGMGDKLFAVPWKSMQLDTQNHEWVIDVSEEQLRQAPGFDKNDWPRLDASYRTSIDDFWSLNTMGRGQGRGTNRGYGAAGF